MEPIVRVGVMAYVVLLHLLLLLCTSSHRSRSVATGAP
jgi:hypothetical protein